MRISDWSSDVCSSDLWANENSGQWWQSRDGGTTSVDFGNVRRAAGESAWLSDSGKAVYPAQILFDPLREGRLWIAAGVGINYFDLPANPAQPRLEERRVGDVWGRPCRSRWALDH